ncbi:hypothetical protein CYJ25_06825 [Schaalia turicensis]|uniref:Uncharacterized protein n=1 Tax=Schaalia turicensis TaxID=131111 RepID=A0A2I1I488_9ACTO|nr:hypothetical protein [Schaalia turicensis]PKY65942.1 hypothetical protein CYJ25_06825 [Schaalia turicensis]
MANTPNFDTEKLRNEALQLRDAVAVHAGRVAVKATELAEQGIDWAAPRAQAALNEAIDRATPLVEDVTARAVDAADRARPAFEKAREEVVEDYIPRIQRAVHEGGAALAADGTPLLERARHASEASQAALTTPTKKVIVKKHRFLRAIGWTALAGTVAGAGYVLWKRSQPIEDPWAEEYWADLETTVDVPATEPEEVEGVEQIDTATEE